MGIIDKAIKGAGIVGALAAAGSAIKKGQEAAAKNLNDTINDFLDRNPRGVVLSLETAFENTGLDLMVSDLMGRELYSVKGSVGSTLNRHMVIRQGREKVAELNADLKLFGKLFDKSDEKPVSISVSIHGDEVGKIKTINASGLNIRYGADFMDAVVQTNITNSGFRVIDDRNHEYLKLEVKGTRGKYYTLLIDDEENELLMLTFAVAVIMIQKIQAQ